MMQTHSDSVALPPQPHGIRCLGEAKKSKCKEFPSELFSLWCKDSSHRTKAWEAATTRCLQMGRGSWCWCTCSCVEPTIESCDNRISMGFTKGERWNSWQVNLIRFDQAHYVYGWSMTKSILLHNVLDQCQRSPATCVPPYHSFKHLPPEVVKC